tara:strand:+ start:35 stop:589 length:555 start_codon:yes stop_codon:yes gene_type:complete
MRYLPNQYINPALTIRDREKDMASSNLNQPGESAPYRIFKRDMSTDDPEDYRGQPMFGVEDNGQMFFIFPFVQRQLDQKTASFTKKQVDGLEKVFPGALDRMNKFRKDKFNLGPIKITPGGPELPKITKGNKDMTIAQGIVRRVEDIKNLSAEDAAKGMRIIQKSSRGMERDKRMGNFLTDLYD